MTCLSILQQTNSNENIKGVFCSENFWLSLLQALWRKIKANHPLNQKFIYFPVAVYLGKRRWNKRKSKDKSEAPPPFFERALKASFWINFCRRNEQKRNARLSDSWAATVTKDYPVERHERSKNRCFWNFSVRAATS